MIWALVGMCGAGKSVAAKWFENQGIPGVYFGRLTMEELGRRGLPVNPENEKKLRQELRDQHGMAAYALLSREPIRNLAAKHPHVYLDGLYSWDEYKVLSDEYGPSLKLIHIWTDRALRYQRLSARPERPLTPSQAEERDRNEIENLAKGGPIAFAHHTLMNHGSPGALEEQLGALLRGAM